MSLRIAMLAPCPFPTAQGTQVVIRDLATALARAGHDVHLITYGYGDPNETPVDEDAPYILHRAARIDTGLRAGPSFLKPAADAALLYTAQRVIKAHHCDLIHAHNVEGLGLGALLKLQTGLPLVYHAHNAMGPELPTYFAQQLMQAFASFVGDVLDRTLPKTADAVVVFDGDHKALHEVYGVANDRVFVIPPGLDNDLLPPLANSSLKDELGDGPVLLYSGNADGYQNLPLLWRALAEVRKTREDVRVLVVSHHNLQAFVPAIKAAGVKDGVILRRAHHPDDLQKALGAATLGVCPRSLWVGAPIKVLNYLHAGLPVVACKSAARHLVPKSAGRLVEATPKAFAEGILELLDQSSAEHESTRAEARQAFERFRIQDHVPAYEDVYAHVLNGAKSV